MVCRARLASMCMQHVWCASVWCGSLNFVWTGTCARWRWWLLWAGSAYLQILRKKPSRWALRIMSPLSSRMAFMNWNSQMDASAATRPRNTHTV